MKKRANKGFTIIEIAIVLVIIGIISAVVSVKMFSIEEVSDAEAVRSIVADLQSTITNGINRGYEVSQLRETERNRLVNILNTKVSGNNITITDGGSTGRINVSIPSHSRSAVLDIDTQGNVTINSVTSFPNYTIVNGDLQKN